MKTTCAIIILCLAVAGCKSFYQETGITITAGYVDAPVEVSDASDIVTVRALFSMTGTRVWAAKGYSVQMNYLCAETNDYFGIVHKRQHVKSDVTASSISTIDGESHTEGGECKSHD